MKKLILIYTLLISLSSFSQTVSGPELNLPIDVYDFGTVLLSNDSLVANFFFKNSGNEPLIIESVKPSCGCTVSSFPKSPILPGDGAVITLKYYRSTEGTIVKSATIHSNAISEPVKVIRISGFIIK